jgi:hypothetical protein
LRIFQKIFPLAFIPGKSLRFGACLGWERHSKSQAGKSL